MRRSFGITGAFFAGLAVAAGAFGAHSLEGIITPEQLETFATAAHYQMTHALALLFVAWARDRFGNSGDDIVAPGDRRFGRDAFNRMRNAQASHYMTVAGYLFAAGIVLFSGSLYLLVLTDTPWLGAVTPFGGVAFVAGWAALGWGLYQS